MRVFLSNDIGGNITTGTTMFDPQLGLNYIQGMQLCAVGGTATYYGSTYHSLVVSLEM
jgi:hypothetical protein